MLRTELIGHFNSVETLYYKLIFYVFLPLSKPTKPKLCAAGGSEQASSKSAVTQPTTHVSVQPNARRRVNKL